MKKTLICCLVILSALTSVWAQKRRAVRTPAKPKPIIFAVLDDGKTIEPIAEIDKGELINAVGGDAEPKPLLNFVGTYYKPKTVYKLIFGGGNAGTVIVQSSNPKAECGKNLATVSTVSTSAKLKGLVMGLATNENPGAVKSTRRLPTAAERAELEALVRAEYVKQGISQETLKTLHYQNLTALDVDHDGTPEFVGSFWVESSAKERNLLFFIADKEKNGKYNFGYSEYQKLTPENIMGGAELKDIDAGKDHELLLDAMEYNGDTSAEIFTVVQGFEGSNFNVYSRQDGKWKKVFEGSNYHCAF